MEIIDKPHNKNTKLFDLIKKYECDKRINVFLIQLSEKIDLSFCTWAYYEQTWLKFRSENTRVLHIELKEVHEFTLHK